MAWRLHTTNGLTLLQCGLLADCPGVRHAFSTRHADAHEDFDLGPAETDDPRVHERRLRLSAAAGLGESPPALLRQVHGARVVRLLESPQARPEPADGLIALQRDRPARVPAVRTADCVPLLLADESGTAVGAVHAGWRGTGESIALRAVLQLVELGVPAPTLRAALGPSIGPCCYEVGPEVVEAVARACDARPETLSRRVAPERYRLDLGRANRLQLLHAGLRPGSISLAPWCSACSPDLFYSYRRDGPVSGRSMACIGWADPPADRARSEPEADRTSATTRRSS